MIWSRASNVDDQSERDYAYVIRLTCLTILLTLWMEWQNFLPESRHPFLALVPLYEPLAHLPSVIDKGIFLVSFIFVVALLITPTNRLAAGGISVCIIFWGMQASSDSNLGFTCTAS